MSMSFDEIVRRIQTGELSEDEAERLLLEVETEQQHELDAGPFRTSDSEDRDLLQSTMEELILKGVGAFIDKTAAQVDPMRGFYDLGIDSTQALELVHQVEAELGLELFPTLLFEYTTPRKLAAFLVSEYGDACRLLLDKVGGPGPVVQPVRQTLVVPPARLKTSPERKLSSQDLPRDIAIIGVAGRYPQAADLGQFWENLLQGRDCITEIPRERWDHSRYFDPVKGTPGKTYSRWGGFMPDVDRFDPLFFNISPREARIIDPQERLFLQTAYHTFENAGYPRARLSGRKVGVYVGVMWGDYQVFGGDDQVHEKPSSSYAAIANRVSYFFDLSGPSLALDTMCSSSLTSIHLACESLRRGETDLALAGGVNVTIHPLKYQKLSQQNFVSSHGRCKAFGEGGDGYVPGEGVGAVLLKPLARAIEDGDHIHAVIKGTAVNHGGRASGFTVPNPGAQAQVITEALRTAGVDPGTITYLEAHGTGTSLGDPIEIAGLNQAFSRSYPAGRRCALGSVKSNIGHCESAAGIAGVTKLVLQLKHQVLVPSIHSEPANDKINFEATCFRVQKELAHWEAQEVSGVRQPRRCGVSSFGAGGSNAHVILEEFVQPAAAASLDRPELVVLSARNEVRLKELASRLADYLDAGLNGAGPAFSLGEVAYSLRSRREALEERLAFVAVDLEEASRVLRSFVSQEQLPEGLKRGNARDAGSPGWAPAGSETTGDSLDARIIELMRQAERWVAGELKAWPESDSGSPVRGVPLPSYPFERKRYWIRQEELRPGAAQEHQLHPLVHRNESSIEKPRYVTSLSGEEFFLKDHVVGGRVLLPGVAYLEMAREAGVRALEQGEVRLDAVRWLRPGYPGAEGLKLAVEIFPSAEGLAFEVLDAGSDAEGLVYADGLLSVAARGEEEVERVSVQEILRRCSSHYSGEEVYARLNESGLSYGARMQGLVELHVGPSEVLGQLRVPEALSGEVSSFRLHPSLQDSALQAVSGFFLGISEETRVPAGLESLELRGEVLSARWVHVESRSRERSEFDLKLLNEEGQVVCLLQGLKLLPLRSARVPEAQGSDLVVVSPVFVESPTPAQAQVGILGTVLWFGEPAQLSGTGLDDVVFVSRGQGFSRIDERSYSVRAGHEEDLSQVLESLAEEGRSIGALVHVWSLEEEASRVEIPLGEALGIGVESLFLVCRELLRKKPGSELPVLFCHPLDRPEYALARGLARVVGQESSRVRVKTIGLEAGSLSSLGEFLPGELGSWPEEDVAVEYRGGVRHHRVLEPVSLSPAGSGSGLKRGGVYLVTGGLGGLGRVFSQHLAEKYQARLILTGRRGLPDEGFLSQLSAAGGDALYVPADITQEAEAERVVQEGLRRFGRIDGVLHSAGVIRDGYIRSKTLGEVREVMSSKTHGVVNLDRALGEMSLDFVVLFSSLAGVTGNAGQADYASGNAFLDEYSRWRNQEVAAGRRHGRTVSIAWPLWRAGGMQVDEASERQMYRTAGLVPLEVEPGLEAFHGALEAPSDSVAVVYGDRDKLRRYLNLEPAPESGTSQPALGRAEIESTLVGIVCDLLQISRDEVDASVSLDEYGLDSVASTELVSRLNERFGLTLGAVVIFEYSSIGALSEHVHALLGSAKSTRRPGLRPVSAADTNGLVSILTSLVAQVLQISAGELGSSVSLEEYGIDSVLTARLIEQINARFELELSPVVVFEFSTIEGLAEHISSLMPGSLREASGAKSQESPSPSSAPASRLTRRPRISSRLLQSEEKSRPSGRGRDVAIIGMAARFPGARDVKEFWENLLEGRDSISEIPSSRFDWRGEYGDRSGQLSRWGGFIEDMDAFDPAFFRISPVEARYMDPQQRLLLETAYHAIEDAGYDPSRLRGSDTGVFIGVSGFDYGELLQRARVETRAFGPAGVSHSIHPNRISYLFDFHGPSEAVDTACSSSLVALDQALKALGEGACSLALVGGVNALLAPHPFVAFSEAGMLSPDGRCKTFSADADGYVRGEGVGVVLLKELEQARADGDDIYAIIKGAAVNHGGAAKSLTAPNPKAQAEVIALAQARAGIRGEDCSYIEAHGTGTRLGDPIEFEGLVRAFSRTSTGERSGYCALGSVKTNIGHLEAAAGMAGLMKVALSLKHRTIPASLHLKEVNPLIELEGSPFHLCSETSGWDLEGAGRGERIAGVSSFGFGGANAHVVLAESREPESRTQISVPGPQVIVISAREESLLRELCSRLGSWFSSCDSADLFAHAAHTLRIGREHKSVRLAFVASTAGEAAAKLESFVRGEDATGRIHRSAPGQSSEVNSLLLQGKAGESILGSLFQEGDLDKLAYLWCAGIDLDWSLLGNGPIRRVHLPGYPFKRERFWLDSDISSSSSLNHDNPCEQADSRSKEGEKSMKSKPSGVLEILSEVLGMELDAQAENAGFSELGLDSIVMVEVISRLEKALDITISIDQLTAWQTLGDLVDSVVGMVNSRDTSGCTQTLPADVEEPLEDRGTHLMERYLVTADDNAPSDYLEKYRLVAGESYSRLSFKTTVVDGERLEFLVCGRGEPILMFSGFFGSGTLLIPVVLHLSQRYQVLLPHFPGFGRSELTDGGEGLFAGFIDGMPEHLEALGCNRPAHVLGYSLGTILSQLYADRHPDLVLSVILCGAFTFLNLPPDRTSLFKMLQELDDDLRRNYRPRAQLPPLDELAHVLKGVESASANVNRSLYAFGFDGRTQLPKLSMPTLVIAGDGDQMSPLSKAAEIAALLPTSTLRIIEGAGHMFCLYQPDEMNRFIDEFLERVGAGTPLDRNLPVRVESPGGLLVSGLLTINLSSRVRATLDRLTELLQIFPKPGGGESGRDQRS